MNISDFFKTNKSKSGKKSYVADGVHFQSRNVKYYTNIEECELAMNCVRILQDEILKSIPRHEFSGITENDEITALFKKPNTFMNTGDFLKYVVYHYVINNNAYVLKVFNTSGDIVSLLPISPMSAEYLQDEKGGYYYRFKFSNSRDIPDTDVDAWRVIHLKRDVTDDSYFGTSTHGSSNDLLELVNTYKTISDNLKESTNAMPNVIFKYDDFAKTSDYERDAREFLNNIKRNKFGILKPHVVIQDAIKMTSQQQATVEMLKYYKQEICNHFRVSEKILNNTATEDEYRAFYNRTIKPILQYFALAFTNAFFTATQQKKGHRIVFAQDDMSLLTHRERIELFEAVQHSSTVKIDEQRAMIGLPALEDGSGDAVMVQLDAVKENVGDKKKKTEEEEVEKDEDE